SPMRSRVVPYTPLFRSSKKPCSSVCLPATQWLASRQHCSMVLTTMLTRLRWRSNSQVHRSSRKVSSVLSTIEQCCLDANHWVARSEEHTSELQSRFDLV